jgi:PAS domain S-box-containing protein
MSMRQPSPPNYPAAGRIAGAALFAILLCAVAGVGFALGEQRWLLALALLLLGAGLLWFVRCAPGRGADTLLTSNQSARHEQLEVALDAARMALWDYDVARREVYLSAHWGGMLGGVARPLRLPVGQLVASVHPDDLPRLNAAFARALRGEAEYRVEHRVRRAGGGWLWILSQGRAVAFEPNGRATRLTGINVDISERVAAETESQPLRANAGAVFHFVAVGMLVLEPHNGRVRDANARALELLGVSLENLRGDDFALCVPPEQRVLYAARLTELSSGQVPQIDLSVQLRHTDGTDRWVQLNGALLSPTGNATVLLMLRDVTEETRARQALRDSERRFRALVDLSSDTYWASDPEHRISAVEGAEGMRFRTLLLGHRRWEVAALAPADGADWSAFKLMCDQQRRFRDFTLELDIGDNSSRFFALSGEPRYDEQGKFLGYHGIARDVTAAVRANRQLALAVAQSSAASEAKTRFLAHMSHELRTPLNSILGVAQLLELGTLDTEQRELVRQQRDSGAQLLRLIDDVLLCSRIDATVLARVEFEPRTWLVDVLQGFEPFYAKRGLSLRWQVEDRVPRHLLGDPERLRHVLERLSDNALKFTRYGGVGVQLDCEHRDGQLWLRCAVRDSGIGIAAPQQEQIFEPFEQVDAGNTRAYAGAGMGLALARRWVESMGGQLCVESELGAGSQFVFTARCALAGDCRAEAANDAGAAVAVAG